MAQGAGVYIIYENGHPVYVGRSRVDIRRRLIAHVERRGNRQLAQALGQGIAMTFEYQHMTSVEQAEAQLIMALGTMQYHNKRREVDPADWE